MSECQAAADCPILASWREAAKLSSIPVMVFHDRDGALRFPKRASVTVAEVPTMVLSETRGL